MKNKLGHDNESEIITIIARLRENRFNLLSINNSWIRFEIVLRHTTTVPVSNTQTQKIEYTITRYPNYGTYDYHIKQLGGIDDRLIPFTYGYTIWELLKTKRNKLC